MEDSRNSIRNNGIWLWVTAAALLGLLAAGAWFFWVRAGLVPLNPLALLIAWGESVRAELPRFGPLAPLAYMGIYIAQIVLAPIPGNGLTFTAGFLFGPFWATVYSLAAILAGGGIAFLLGRRIGWPLIEKLAPPSWLARWGNLAAVNSSLTWFLLMLAPTADVLYFLAGLTRLSFRRMMLLILLGRTPGVVLSTLLGANVETLGVGWMAVLVLALMGLAWLGHHHRDALQARLALLLERSRRS